MFLRSYLQQKYSISRRKFTELVDEHRIFLDGKIVESYKQEIQRNEALRIKNEEGKYFVDEKVDVSGERTDSILVVFNKPVGYVVSKADPHNQTIYELLPKEFQQYYYIGRLDKDSRGLLLLTNDPKLVHEFEHPKFGIEKKYIVKIHKPLDALDIQKMEEGVIDEGELLKVMRIKDHGTKQTATSMIFDIVLNEGKKRHIRRMFKVLGYKVLDLQRIREGKFELGDLKEGEWKTIKDTKI